MYGFRISKDIIYLKTLDSYNICEYFITTFIIKTSDKLRESYHQKMLKVTIRMFLMWLEDVREDITFTTLKLYYQKHAQSQNQYVLNLIRCKNIEKYIQMKTCVIVFWKNNWQGTIYFVSLSVLHCWTISLSLSF